MNSIMTEMLKKYQENGDTDKKNAIKEIMQEAAKRLRLNFHVLLEYFYLKFVLN